MHRRSGSGYAWAGDRVVGHDAFAAQSAIEWAIEWPVLDRATR